MKGRENGHPLFLFVHRYCFTAGWFYPSLCNFWGSFMLVSILKLMLVT